MKKGITFLLAIIIIVCFLLIQISYNGGVGTSIFSNLVVILKESKTGFKLDNRIDNFNYSLIEFLLITTYLLTVSLVYKKRLILIGYSLFIILWGFWLYMYNPYIEVDLYLKTSIPFLSITIISSIVISNLSKSAIKQN